MTEAEYLDTVYPYTEEYVTESIMLKHTSRFQAMTKRYKVADKANVGEIIKCPYCGTNIKKKSYQHKFCNTKCKDRYWNYINPRGLYA